MNKSKEYLESIGYKPDTSLLNELETYYSYVLDNMAMNYADPVSANVGFLNNSGKFWTDPQKVGRTFVYITRPNLNLRSRGNIARCRILQYTCGNKLGITANRFLMYPDIVKYINYSGVPELNYVRTGALVGTADDTIIGEYGRIDPNNGETNPGVEKTGHSYPIGKTPFNAVLSNFCTETSGGRDIVLNTEQTDQNFTGNYTIYASGINETRGPGELTLTFNDPYGSPVFLQMLTWVFYMHNVAKGVIVPEMAYGLNRILDYTCSIYVFMLDTDHKTIIRWNKYTGCFPVQAPMGNIMHGTESLDTHGLEKLSIPFKYNFESPMDPAVLAEFNMISECALCSRHIKKGGSNLDYGVDLGEDPERPNFDPVDSAFYNRHVTSPIEWFRGMNHYLTYKEALYFRNTWCPDEVPGKLLNPKNSYDRMTEIYTPGTVDGYWGPENGNVGGVYGDERWIDDGAVNIENGMKPTKTAFASWQLGNYFGKMGSTYYNRHPYVVEGNTLMFL